MALLWSNNARFPQCSFGSFPGYTYCSLSWPRCKLPWLIKVLLYVLWRNSTSDSSWLVITVKTPMRKFSCPMQTVWDIDFFVKCHLEISYAAGPVYNQFHSLTMTYPRLQTRETDHRMEATHSFKQGVRKGGWVGVNPPSLSLTFYKT